MSRSNIARPLRVTRRKLLEVENHRHSSHLGNWGEAHTFERKVLSFVRLLIQIAFFD
jgi:hypothetical protein